MLKAFIRLWLITLLTQTETCYASHIGPASLVFSTDILSNALDSSPGFYADGNQESFDIQFFAESEAPYGESGGLISPVEHSATIPWQSTVLFVVFCALLVVVILQWLAIQKWKSRSLQQSRQLDSLNNHIEVTELQLKTTIRFSEGLYQQIQFYYDSKNRLLTALTEDIANPVSVIQTSFIGWLKLSRLNDVMLEKARLIEKSVERIERFLQHARYATEPANQKQEGSSCDIVYILRKLSSTLGFALQIPSQATTSVNNRVKGDESSVEFILSSIFSQVLLNYDKASSLSANLEDQHKTFLLSISVSARQCSGLANKLQSTLPHPLISEMTAQCGIEVSQAPEDSTDHLLITFERSPNSHAGKAAAQPEYIPPVVFEASQQPVMLQPGPSPTSPKCLIIESSPEMQVCIVQALKEYFCCKGIFNSTATMQQVNDWQPDIIVAELQSGYSDGFNLIRELKKNTQSSTLPILLVTNQGTTENKLKALELDIDSLLEKPFSEELLLKTAVKLSKNYQSSKHSDEVKENVEFQQSKDAIFLAQLNSLIEKHIANAEFRFEDYFGQFALSKRQFFRKVNTLTRCTPKQYLIQKRLELARHLLAKGVLLEDVTSRCGFKDQQSMMKIYAAHFGEEVV